MKKPFELQSLVDTHDRPFAVIDRDYQIVAVNVAFEREFGISRTDAVGRHCFRIEHHSDRPCHELGLECPYLLVYNTEEPHSCLHTHYDGKGRRRWVRINVYPLRASDGKLYLGEMLREIGIHAEENAEEEVRPAGKSPAFLRCMEQLQLAAQSDAPVLLLGETGSGKELAASFVHRHSARRKGPFLSLDCTVLTETLFESEVFGHERGAFTGSVGAKQGLFELAERGTAFLDEIGETPSSVQAKLLRVLETGEFRRLGGHKTLRSDARVVCATNRHLWEQVKSGAFRQDLYHRIACFCIYIPPLRDRLEDIPELAESLLDQISRKSGVPYRVGSGAIAALKSHHYPGNVRELRNLLQVAATHSRNGAITRKIVEQCLELKRKLSRSVELGADPAGPAQPGGTASGARPAENTRAPSEAGRPSQPDNASAQAPRNLTDLEAEHIAELLGRYGGHRRRVAQVMGISERTLYRKLKRYGLGR